MLWNLKYLLWLVVLTVRFASLEGLCEDDPNFIYRVDGQDLTCVQLVKGEKTRWRCVTLGMNNQPCCQTCRANFATRPYAQATPEQCSDEETFTLQVDGETINCQTIGLFYPFTYLCFDYDDQCCGQCAHVDLSCYDIPWNIEINGMIFSCSLFADRYPALCRNPFYASECCHSCQSADRHACGDNPFRLWKLNNGSSTSCEEYIVEDTDRCLDPDVAEHCCWTCDKVTGCINHMGGELTLPSDVTVTTCKELVKTEPFYCKPQYYGGPHSMCCRSCAGVDTQCMDGPLLNFTAPDSDSAAYNCARLAQVYPYFCTLSEYNDPDTGVCCSSCYAVDSTCVDDPYNDWTTSDGETIKCERYVKENPASCETDAIVRSKCCSSCKVYDQCKDQAGELVEIKLLGNLVKISCETLAEEHPTLCNDDKYGGFKIPGQCCRSCVNLYVKDEHCTDHNPGSQNMTLPTGDSVPNCNTLAKEYPFYCNEDHFGGPGKKCCSSCKTIEATCQDNPELAWEEGKETLNCEEHVKKNPEDCEDARLAETCCKSCKLLPSCKDDELVEVNFPGLDINETLSCQEVNNKYSGLCLTDNYGGFPYGKCCKACVHTDKSCVDDIHFEVEIYGSKVRCDDIPHFPEMCENNIEYALDMCCHTCSKLSGDARYNLEGPDDDDDKNGAGFISFGFLVLFMCWIFQNFI